MLVQLVLLTLAHGAEPASAEALALAAKECPDNARAIPEHAFTLQAPGKPWDKHTLVPAVGNTRACLLHIRPDGKHVAYEAPFATCMNCGPSEVQAISFADLDKNGTPDVSLVVAGTVGWDPQELSGSRFIVGQRFYIWTSDAEFTVLEAAKQEAIDALEGVKTLPELHKKWRP